MSFNINKQSEKSLSSVTDAMREVAASAVRAERAVWVRTLMCRADGLRTQATSLRRLLCKDEARWRDEMADTLDAIIARVESEMGDRNGLLKRDQPEPNDQNWLTK